MKIGVLVGQKWNGSSSPKREAMNLLFPPSEIFRNQSGLFSRRRPRAPRHFSELLSLVLRDYSLRCAFRPRNSRGALLIISHYLFIQKCSFKEDRETAFKNFLKSRARIHRRRRRRRHLERFRIAFIARPPFYFTSISDTSVITGRR